MMTDRFKIITLLALLQWLPCMAKLAEAAESVDDKLMLIPDQFHISERFHQPQFSIEKIADGYKVKLAYSADTGDLSQYLFQLYGSGISSKEIYEVELLPIKFQHFSTIFEEKNIVKSWRVTFQLNEVHLEYIFTKDLSQNQIQNIFTFGYALASVDAEIQCSGQITSRFCDQTIEKIPLFNQRALTANSADSALFADYSDLSKDLSFVRLGKAYLNLTTSQDVDAYLKTTLFAGGHCKAELIDISARICQLIEKYTQSQSLIDSINIIAGRLFQNRPVDSSKNFYILDSSQFSITNAGPVDDKNCSVFDSFCPISN